MVSFYQNSLPPCLWLVPALLLAPQSLAFQATHRTATTRPPLATLQQHRIRKQHHASFVLHQQTEPAGEGIEERVPTTPAFSPGNNNTAELLVPVVEAQQQDVAKDLFLENIPENLAMVELLEEENKIDDSSNNDVPPLSPPLESRSSINEDDDGTLPANNNDKENVVNTVLPPSLEDLEVKDTVSAILAASEEAVSKAEASLSEDVAARLEPFASPQDGGDDIPSTATTTSTASLDPPATSVVEEIVPASQVVGESALAETTTTTATAPSVGKILAFAVPAVGVMLCDPLLSLIDTSAVGMLSGTIHQAALTPACAITDYAALLIAFVFTATTNLIAAARETDKGVEGSPRVTRNLVGSLQLSTYVGASLGAVLFVYARQLINAIVGSGAVNPAVLDAATIYVRIRALGMPAAAMIGSAQAACLGLQDIKSQFIVLATAAVVNFFGDMLLVGSKNAWIGGAAGAAWATVISQYAAVALFAQWLCHKPKKGRSGKNSKAKIVNLSNAILDLVGKNGKGKDKLQDAVGALTEHPNNTATTSKKRGSRVLGSVKRFFGKRPSKGEHDVVFKPKEKAFSVRGFLDGKVKKRNMFQFPSMSTVREFWPYFLPVTFAQVGRVSGYVAMSYVVASSFGTLAMAAQQIVASIVYCLFPVADSLSLTGQAFVPPIMEKGATKERALALRKTMVNLSKAAGVFGLFTAGAVALTPLVSGFLTSDPAVLSMVNGAVPLLAASFPVYALAMAFEGFLLGQKDLGFQGKLYTSWCFIVPYFMLQVKNAALGGAKVGINAVWGVLFGYQVMRFLSWTVRTLFLQRQIENDIDPAKI